MSEVLGMPRLSEDYAAEATASGRSLTPQANCMRCGSLLSGPGGRTVWREHDERDRPEMIFVVLCAACSDRVIEPHPRLYAELGKNEPAPGVMKICADCRHQVGARCYSPKARANGGQGLPFPEADSTMHILYSDKAARRRGHWSREWKAEPSSCQGWELADADQEHLNKAVDEYQARRAQLLGRDIWIVERGGIGHKIASDAGPIVAACGKTRWRHATVIEREPRRVCEDCRRVITGEPARVKTGEDPKREAQGRLFR